MSDADYAADYEIVEAPSRWDCPEREPDGVTLPPHVADAWRETIRMDADWLWIRVGTLTQIGELRHLAARLEAQAGRLRESADLWEQSERRYRETQHHVRAIERRWTGREVVPLADVPPRILTTTTAARAAED